MYEPLQSLILDLYENVTDGKPVVETFLVPIFIIFNDSPDLPSLGKSKFLEQDLTTEWSSRFRNIPMNFYCFALCSHQGKPSISLSSRYWARSVWTASKLGLGLPADFLNSLISPFDCTLIPKSCGYLVKKMKNRRRRIWGAFEAAARIPSV